MSDFRERKVGVGGKDFTEEMGAEQYLGGQTRHGKADKTIPNKIQPGGEKHGWIPVRVEKVEQ